MKITYANDSLAALKLIELDPTLKPIFAKTKIVEFELESDHFLALVSAIVSQQLSGKVAQAIYKKVDAFFSGEITPEKILAADIEDMRKLGLSYRKAEYIKSIATHVMDGTVRFDTLDEMSDEDIIEMLVKIKGIGRWSAEMFLMFALGRPNVFSSGDFGLRKALSMLYGEEISVDKANELSLKWDPYKTVVAYYLWRFLEG